MGNCEAMTSSTRSFAYSYQLVKKCFLKICETSKCHNFLIFQPIFIRFSLFYSQICTLSYKIKLNLFRISPLTIECYRNVNINGYKSTFLFPIVMWRIWGDLRKGHIILKGDKEKEYGILVRIYLRGSFSRISLSCHRWPLGSSFASAGFGDSRSGRTMRLRCVWLPWRFL